MLGPDFPTKLKGKDVDEIIDQIDLIARHRCVFLYAFIIENHSLFLENSPDLLDQFLAWENHPIQILFFLNDVLIVQE